MNIVSLALLSVYRRIITFLFCGAWDRSRVLFSEGREVGRSVVDERCGWLRLGHGAFETVGLKSDSG